MRVLILFLFLVGFFSFSCERNDLNKYGLKCDVKPVNGSNEDITGKWRKIKSEYTFTPTKMDPIDYSCDNVIYHFKSDGVVEITSDIFIEGPDPGSYAYEITTESPWEGMTEYGSLKIRGSSWACSIKDNWMKLSQAPTDGMIDHFIRVE